MNRLILFLFVYYIAFPICAQTRQWSALEQGNSAFRNGHYAEAEKHYLKLLQQQPNNAAAHYNLGCAYMEQQNTEAALQAFADAVRLSDNEELKARAWHNIGVLHQGKAVADQAERAALLHKAADAYKESLRVNPSDDETRYNLALCQHQLRNDDNSQQQNQEQQQNQDQENQPQDQPEQQQDPTQQLMNLAQRAEDDTRQKINEARAQQRSLDKNW